MVIFRFNCEIKFMQIHLIGLSLSRHYPLPIVKQSSARFSSTRCATIRDSNEELGNLKRNMKVEQSIYRLRVSQYSGPSRILPLSFFVLSNLARAKQFRKKRRQNNVAHQLTLIRLHSCLFIDECRARENSSRRRGEADNGMCARGS